MTGQNQPCLYNSTNYSVIIMSFIILGQPTKIKKIQVIVDI